MEFQLLDVMFALELGACCHSEILLSNQSGVMGRLQSVQGLPSIKPDGKVKLPHVVAFGFTTSVVLEVGW